MLTPFRAVDIVLRVTSECQTSERKTNGELIMRLPTRDGITTHFAAFEKLFFVKRISRAVFCLWMYQGGERMRFGTRSEILEDIEYIEDNGCLPPKSKTPVC